MSLPNYRVDIKQDLAKYLLRDGVESGIQFSQTRDVHIDHAFTVPLSFLRPTSDLPIVPIITNAFGYPLANNMRWYELGTFLKRAIAAWPGKERVAIVASFNLTVEVGGPKMGNIDLEFARYLLELMGKGARTDMLEKLTVERLIAHGNSTTEFLNYIAALGVSWKTACPRSSNTSPSKASVRARSRFGRCDVRPPKLSDRRCCRRRNARAPRPGLAPRCRFA
jgi:protocatechuate 4,5-dioxygenase beta chain